MRRNLSSLRMMQCIQWVCPSYLLRLLIFSSFRASSLSLSRSRSPSHAPHFVESNECHHVCHNIVLCAFFPPLLLMFYFNLDPFSPSHTPAMRFSSASFPRKVSKHKSTIICDGGVWISSIYTLLSHEMLYTCIKRKIA